MAPLPWQIAENLMWWRLCISVWFGMLEMFLPVGGVLLSECSITNGQEGFRVLPLGRFGEIEASYKDCGAIDDHDLVVGNGVLSVDSDWNAGMVKEFRRRVMSGAIAAVENDFHLYTASMGVHERFGCGR